MTSTDHTPATPAVPPGLDPDTIGASAIASATLRLIAFEMRIPEAQVTQAMALSNWTTIEEMIGREFISAYRHYYPKCGMAIRNKAVIAEVFDSLAITFDDPRRALRSGIWTPPVTSVGGRSDG